MPSKDSEIIHANCVSFDGKGLLILGASGAGKSSLTFEMIALGATLVSDDRTCLRVVGQSLWAEPPEAIRGIIEARGVGILPSPCLQGERISAAVDLDRIEDQRLVCVCPRRIRAVSGGAGLVARKWGCCYIGQLHGSSLERCW